MTQTDQWDRIRELFEEVSLHAPDERRDVLRKLCPDDPNLQIEVLSLLEHDERAKPDFLSPPTQAVAAPVLDEPDPLVGARLGKCTIRRVIASGGMGVVYEADQDTPRRTVAIKIMRSLAWSGSARRRFELEVEALARLTHPNIAQIYDADTTRTSGKPDAPYFVMEFVPQASPITRFADDHGLDRDQRLQLFLQACDAVHYGHQRGIIHRDLKPANILVGAAGVVKVIDFGVAKATDADVAVTTMHTDAGQLLGTIQYMSPEQCQADPLGLDVRTDIYSLGVVLYELVVGKLPYEVADTSLPSAIRMVCETQPVRPSAINSRLRGDLETIVLKALEKNRSRRYQSVADFSRDIRHYLAREPIEARKPNVIAVARRWAKTHPVIAALLLSTFWGPAGASVMLFVSNQYLKQENLRLQGSPAYLDRSENAFEVYLRSDTNQILHTWKSSNEPNGLAYRKRFVEVHGPPSKRLALVGFPPGQQQFSGAWCAFDVDSGKFEEPVWCSRIQAEDMPTVEKERGFHQDDFSALHVLAETDIFPAMPGRELILTYQHTFSRRALRVCRPDNGEVLFQVWHDGCIPSVYWLENRGLLVVGGQNEDVQWPQRGGPLTTKRWCPWAVWAIRPQLGSRWNRYVYAGRFDREKCIEPAWYKVIMPEDSTKVFNELTVTAPTQASQNDLDYFEVHLGYDQIPGWEETVTVSLLVDASGDQPDLLQPVKPDAYLAIERAKTRPPSFRPIEEFKLENLPPISKSLP